jgi:hypothetical protein
MYGISSQSVGLVSFNSVVLLSWSFVVFWLKRFMSEKTTRLGYPFHDAIFLRNCNAWASFVGKQLLFKLVRAMEMISDAVIKQQKSSIEWQ